jgi:hypothetical protein
LYFEKLIIIQIWTIGSKLRPKVLQHVPVPVIENNICEGWHRQRGINIRIYDEMMCAGYEFGGRDACQVWITYNCLAYNINYCLLIIHSN